MTVMINKSKFNLRETLNSLKLKTGLKGLELLRANTAADVYTAINPAMFRNRIINGGMAIAQRGTSAVVSNNSGQYPVDRFYVEAYGGGALTSQQTNNAPAGFQNSTILTVTTTDTSLDATDDYEINHKIEGLNVADLGWGTANAKTITLSFWVRSSVTGSYSFGFQNSAASRSYVGLYTINSANTWEQKTITIAGDTTGSWDTGTGAGFFLRWCLATGSNRIAAAANTWESANRIAIGSTANPLMGTSGATFYITGVQLEAGSVATPFEYRPYATELALCQRYFCAASGYVPRINAGSELGNRIFWPVTMRASPTVTIASVDTENNGTPSVIRATVSGVDFYKNRSGNEYIVLNVLANAEL